jgi:phosphoglycolate phosphatase
METLYPEISAHRYQEFIDAYRKHFHLQAQTAVALFPGVKSVLGRLDSRGYVLAVATGKSRRGLDRELRESGLQPLIGISRCADEAPSKPHPQMLVDLLELAGVEPGMTLMVGDTTYDMQMARDAGVDRVAVSYGAHDRSRLIEFEPLEIVDSLSGLEYWLSETAQAI